MTGYLNSLYIYKRENSRENRTLICIFVLFSVSFKNRQNHFAVLPKLYHLLFSVKTVGDVPGLIKLAPHVVMSLTVKKLSKELRVGFG